MNTGVPIEARLWLNPLSEFVRSRLGLNFPEAQWNVLHRNFLKGIESFGFTDPTACLEWLIQGKIQPETLHKLAGCLTIGETYFFRERNHFEPMARHVFGEVIRRKRESGHKQLRIWSAACSTGEEPYSIAMMLDSLLPDLQEWSIRILATDINPDFLKKARTAHYRQWSFRGTPDWVKQRYFKIEGDLHVVREDIQKRVSFDFLNLAEDIYPSLATQTQAMDIIFCRNALIYFSAEQAYRVVHRLQKALVENGWLVLSPTETIYAQDPLLQRQYVQDAILYRKNPAKTNEDKNTANHQDPGGPNRFRLSFTRSNITPPIPTPIQRELTPPIRSVTPKEPTPATDSPEKKINPPSWTEELERLILQGRYRETVDRIQAHLQGGAATGFEAYLLARAEANLGELDEALHHALHALESDKLRPEYHYLLAMIQQERNNLDEAERALQRVLYLNEEHVMAHFSLGHLKLQQNRVTIAEKHFLKALHLLDLNDSMMNLQESEGITAERLRELIGACLSTLKV